MAATGTATGVGTPAGAPERTPELATAVIAQLAAVDIARANQVAPGALAYGNKVTTAPKTVPLTSRT